VLKILPVQGKGEQDSGTPCTGRSPLITVPSPPAGRVPADRNPGGRFCFLVQVNPVTLE